MKLTRKKVLEDLASSSIYGNLGIFAGAGVSMAIWIMVGKILHYLGENC